MKKLTAALLCLTLLALSALGAAETAETEKTGKTRMATLDVGGAFTIQGNLPEGYFLVPQTMEEGRYIAVITTGEETGRPDIWLSIAYDELLSEVGRLNDLDEAALAQIEATFREEDEVEIGYRETDYGTKVMVVRFVAEDEETGEKTGTAAVDFYTIYRGFEVEIIMTPTGGETLITEDQITMAIDFLSDMDFVETK